MVVAHTYAEPSDVAKHLGLPGLRVVHVRAERSGLRDAHAALRARIAAAVGA
jgi:hypothetical protein